MFKFVFKLFILLFIAWVLPYLYFSVTEHPRLYRDWTADQKVLAEITFGENDQITIKNIRNNFYNSTTDYISGYYDKTFNLKDVVGAWFVVEPFGSFGAAHTFVSYELKDGSYISISAEIRKEIGEVFGPIRGLFRQYELVYVIANEADVIKLRTNFRKDNVYLYPIKSTPEKIQATFKDMLIRANKLSKDPEFYNTLTNNCTTNIVKHVRNISDKDIPWWDVRYLFPETVDALAYDLGLIDTDLTPEEARKHFFITEKALFSDPNGNFSEEIRKF